MKVIDLLNKIAKGEEVPKKIDYNGEIFIYNEALKRYVIEYEKNSDSSTYCLGGFFALDMGLDHNIKIIEEVEGDEFEDITTINICPKDDAYFIDTLNDLIKNQKKIIEQLKNK